MLLRLATLLTSFSLLGCASMIPNTTVEDTPENRRVVEFVELYRKAVEERDVRALLEMASPVYLDDNGTPLGEDDIDFESLRTKLSSWRDRVLDVRYEIKYRRVTWEETRIFVEFRYTASFRVKLNGGDERWSRRLNDHRLVLTEDEGEERFQIVSGM